MIDYTTLLNGQFKTGTFKTLQDARDYYVTNKIAYNSGMLQFHTNKETILKIISK